MRIVLTRFAYAITVCLFLMAITASGLLADAWQWPQEITVGGFSVTSVRGSANPDGSGAATGFARMPGVGVQRAALTRSASGAITGSVPLNTKVAGAEIRANLTLDDTGLKGKGSIKTIGKPVIEGDMVIDTRGLVTGFGEVALGAIEVPVKFSISTDSFKATGSVPAQAYADTPLASYEFEGEIKLDGVPPGEIKVTANGRVRRTGKLSNQVTECQVADVVVNTADGQARVNVEGVGVAFEFFKP